MQAPSATEASAISGPMEWSEKPTTALGKAFRFRSVTPRRLTISAGGVEVGAFQKRVVDPRLVQDIDRGANGFNGLHPRRQDHRLALAGDVADQRQVVGLSLPIL
jgi:hypothetical protein